MAKVKRTWPGRKTPKKEPVVKVGEGAGQRLGKGGEGALLARGEKRRDEGWPESRAFISNGCPALRERTMCAFS